MLEDEYAFLHASGEPRQQAGPFDRLRAGSTQPATLTPEEILRRHGQAGHAALCLSGGGVRSGSFGLGVLEGLARAGVLDKFDYLSTVSGGGYIGGWFTAWRLHARARGEADPAEQLAQDIEPEPLTRLRRVIKFLDPRTGVLSADVWTLGGTMFRNLLVNWMVLIPLIATAAMVPRLYLGLLGLPSQPELVSRATLDWWYVHDWIPIVILIAIGDDLCRSAAAEPRAWRRPAPRASRSGFWGRCCWCMFLFSVHRFWAWRFGDDVSLGIELVVSAAAMVVPWIVGGAFSKRWWRPWTWIAAAAAGLVGRLVIWWAHHFITALAQHDPQVFVVVDLPTSLGLLFLQITVFIGLASRDMSDDDREWWARAGAWILILGLSWLVASAVAILGPLALDAGLDALGFSHARWAGGTEPLHGGVGRGGLPHDRGARLAGQTMAVRDRGRAVPGRAADHRPAGGARLGRQPTAAAVHSRPPAVPRESAPGGRVAARGSSRVLRSARRRRRPRPRDLDQSVLAARDVPQPARADVPRRLAPEGRTPSECIHRLRCGRRHAVRPRPRTSAVPCTSSTPR